MKTPSRQFEQCDYNLGDYRAKLGAMGKDVEVEALLAGDFSNGQTQGGKPPHCP